MREQPKNQISPDGLKVWRLQEIMISAVCLLIVIAVAVLSYFFHWPYWISGVLGAVWLLGSVVTVYLIPKVRHKVWRYEVHENEIDIQSGIFVVTRVIVPMVRVQHVDTSQGPLLRKYNLATVKIFTAATVHSIPALEMKEADQLRDSISRLARVTDDDV
ncbi:MULTISPECIES: PH domain-containing protein [Bacillus]|uniref:PH domain-containing protein n=1 Tax=Bacillus TaxID=1386 RepID=UPI0002887AD1|nr:MULTISPECIES: PH domain-containing protein [Bacillus]MCC2931395.1 PH domain-containing protein [Bacillus sp. LBG-1-113]MCY9089398.1 PH domain-containing protein [Bacillus mojavensis]MDR4229082.1 PH domain-containing protein [Bacillus mojavensis]MEC1612166.1 PH domain-containing protein [Bacillus mojavensis]MEC1623198.1 PH domain-containing protein [Bacillus mojavensis]